MNALPEVTQLIERLATGVRELFTEQGRQEPYIVGIHTGGVWVARQLARALEIKSDLGTLNINFYRDDFTRNGMHPRVEPSSLADPIDDRHVVLVDDVLFTGRTIRAAMNEIFDYGRPASVSLAVLVSRSGRELPVQADVSALSLNLSDNEYVKLSGPDDLKLAVHKRS